MIPMKACLSECLALTLAAGTLASAEMSSPPASPVWFQPTWSSLQTYQTPEWFRDAKFGIWAHWGPQCEPEAGDWYARNMYIEGHDQYKAHVVVYGHPSRSGFKDVIRQWKAEKFDPEKLLAFYKESGAKYFVALANHHDNLDLWDSKFQAWNSVALGPKRDIVGGWAAAAKKAGLRFGVSVHAARTWAWYEVAQGADKEGPLAGLPYDGKLTKADGKGQWWEGLDPQGLYEQNHAPKAKPDQAYIDKFFQRTRQLIQDYAPDLVYFDDGVLPLRKADEAAGLSLVADYYNASAKLHGKNEAVVNTKALNEDQSKALVYDIERGRADRILSAPWQTDTCIGQWHYSRAVYDKKEYKSAAVVVPMLADIVSKNGNLLLSVPLRRDGMPDEDEMEIVADIGAWLKVNGEGIYATRPWTIYGEGPSTMVSEGGKYGGQNDTYAKPLTAEDIRFTQSQDGSTLYAIVLAIPPGGIVLVKSLAAGSSSRPEPIGRVQVLGVPGDLKFTRDAQGLHVTLPDKSPCKIAVSLKITKT